MKNRMLVVVALLSMLISVSQGAIECDFESPTYTAGTSFFGVDGWSTFSTTPPPSMRITPDPLTSGYTKVISGGQSGLFYSPSDSLSKGFTSSSDIGAQTTVSAQVWIDTGSSYLTLLSNNIATGATPLGLFMSGGSFKVLI